MKSDKFHKSICVERKQKFNEELRLKVKCALKPENRVNEANNSATMEGREIEHDIKVRKYLVITENDEELKKERNPESNTQSQGMSGVASEWVFQKSEFQSEHLKRNQLKFQKRLRENLKNPVVEDFSRKGEEFRFRTPNQLESEESQNTCPLRVQSVKAERSRVLDDQKLVHQNLENNKNYNKNIHENCENEPQVSNQKYLYTQETSGEYQTLKDKQLSTRGQNHQTYIRTQATHRVTQLKQSLERCALPTEQKSSYTKQKNLPITNESLRRDNSKEQVYKDKPQSRELSQQDKCFELQSRQQHLNLQNTSKIHNQKNHRKIEPQQTIKTNYEKESSILVHANTRSATELVPDLHHRSFPRKLSRSQQTLSHFIRHCHTSIFRQYFYFPLLLFTLLLFLLSATSNAACRNETARPCETICSAATSNCTLRALLLLPDDDSYITSMRSSMPALLLAEEYIRNSSLLPSQLHFEWMTDDVKCDASYATIKAMDGISKSCAHVVFGPVCDYALAAVSRIAKYFNSNGTPVISVGGATDSFEDKKTTCADEFYMLVRSGLLSFRSLSVMAIELLKRYNWSNTIALYEPNGRDDVVGEHSCFLMMKSFSAEMRLLNLTIDQYALAPQLRNRTEEVKREIGNKHASKCDSLSFL